jgi:peptidyl-prolyl cis-trans isomerase D
MMLQNIREKASGLVLWVIVILISLSFALWGVNSYFERGGQVNAAKVNGTEITQQAFFNRYQQQRSQEERSLPEGKLGLSAADEARIKADVIETMIRETLEQQWMEKLGIRIGDQQLANYIAEFPEFQVQGQFQPDLYRQFLANNRYSETYFEEVILRPWLATTQLTQSIRATAFDLPEAAERLMQLESQQRELIYTKISSELFKDKIEVSQDEIQQFYTENPDDFYTMEQATFSYLELDVDTLIDRFGDELAVDEETVAARYDMLKDSFQQPETRRVRHILLTVEKDADPELLNSKRTELEEIRSRILAGELSFEEAAKQYSEDPGSASKGGDLGFFGKGMMVAEFEEAAFSMDKEQISEPVQTDYGYHVLQLVEIKEERIQPVSEVADQIIREIQMEKAQLLLIQKSELLANLTWEFPESLDPAAEALGLEVKTTGTLFPQLPADILRFPAVADLAFDADFLKNGHNSDVLNVAEDKRIVFRVNTYEPSVLQPLDEVAESIRTHLEQKKATDMAEELAGGMADLIRKGIGFEDALADDKFQEYGLESVKTGMIQRNDREHPAQIIRKGFSLSFRGDVDKVPQVSVTQLPNGDVAVVELVDVMDGDVSEMDAERREQRMKISEYARAEAELNAARAALRDSAKVVIYELAEE